MLSKRIWHTTSNAFFNQIKLLIKLPSYANDAISTQLLLFPFLILNSMIIGDLIMKIETIFV